MASKGLAFLAGAGEGLVEGERLRRASDIENRKLALTEKQIASAESKARQDALMGQVKTLDDSFAGIVSNVEKMLTANDVSPQALAAAASLRDPATAGFKRMEDMGVIPAGTYDSRRAVFDTVLKTGVSSAERGRLKGMEAAAEAQANPQPLSDPAKVEKDFQEGRLSQAAYNKAMERPAQDIVTVILPDNTEQAFRKNDPALDAALKQGASIKMAERPAQDVINVKFPGGKEQAFRKNDPALDEALKAGATRFDQTTQLKEGEMLAAGYASRMSNSARILASLESSGFKPDVLSSAVAGTTLGNFTTSPAFQTYRQASDDWIRAKLRKESGAVIGEEEMNREYKTYFPQPGETPEVVRQKALARRVAEDAMATMAGNAYKPATSQTPPPAAKQTDAAVPPPDQRKVGEIYQTPRGPLRWQGTGWAQP